LSRDLSELIETYLSQSAGVRRINRKSRSTVATVRITALMGPDASCPSPHKIVIQSGRAISSSAGPGHSDTSDVCISDACTDEPRLRALLSATAMALRELSKETRALARLSRRMKSPLASEGYSHLLEQQVNAVNLGFARYIKSRGELFLYIKTSFWRSKLYGGCTGPVQNDSIPNLPMNSAGLNLSAPMAASGANQLAPHADRQPNARRGALMVNA
jgi:hypothetical protein